MKKEQKIVSSKSVVDQLLKEGWKIVAVNSSGQGYNAPKTCCLGLIFLPLALLGRKPDKTEYILERDIPNN